MIITDDKDAQAEQPEDGEQNSEALPPYTLPNEASQAFNGAADTSRATAGSSVFVRSQPPFTLQRRCNFVRMVRSHDAITENFILDPIYKPPASISAESPGVSNEGLTSENENEGDLSSRTAKDADKRVGQSDRDKLAEEGKRDNILLETTHSSINADVWILFPTPEEVLPAHMPPVSIVARSTHGNVSLKLQHDAEWYPSGFPAPVKVTVSSQHGGVRVGLPRSFVGLITTSTKHGWVTHSSEIAPHIAVYSEVKGDRKAFMGELDASNINGDEEWKGSSVKVTSTYGTIRIMYADEMSSSKSILGTLRSWVSL